MAAIDAIVFDVGRVLVDFSLDAFAQFLRSHGAIVSDEAEFIEKSGMREYELGRLTSEAFLRQVAQLLEKPVDEQELARRWQTIFQPIPEMIELLDSLSATHRTFMLSNTNELHWQYLSQEYRLGDKAVGVITSYTTGALKPSAEIFIAAERQHKLIPTSTVFIDDIEDHIVAVRKRGWHGIHHQSVEETRAELHHLGIAN